MKHAVPLIITSAGAVLLAFLLLVTTSLIPLTGRYVLNAAAVDDALHRDDRGIPIIFLKRSLADGQCEVSDSRSTTCLPMSKTFIGQGQHEVSYAYLGADFAYWLVLSTATIALYNSRRHKISSNTES